MRRTEEEGKYGANEVKEEKKKMERIYRKKENEREKTKTKKKEKKENETEKKERKEEESGKQDQPEPATCTATPTPRIRNEQNKALSACYQNPGRVTRARTRVTAITTRSPCTPPPFAPSPCLQTESPAETISSRTAFLTSA